MESEIYRWKEAGEEDKRKKKTENLTSEITTYEERNKNKSGCKHDIKETNVQKYWQWHTYTLP